MVNVKVRVIALMKVMEMGLVIGKGVGIGLLIWMGLVRENGIV